MTSAPRINQAELRRIRAAEHARKQRERAGADPPPELEPDATPRDEDPPPRRRVDPHDRRPEIVRSSDQPAVTDAAIDALARRGGIYVRGRHLVHVVRDHGTVEWLARPEGAAVIVPIECDHLLDLLGRAARWTAIRDGQRCAAAPPAWLARRIMARGQWPFPQLEGISDAPVLRADGTIQDQAGYDPATRIIFEPGSAAFPPISAQPSRVDAARALAELVEPFREFAFQEESDRSAAAALVLSIVGRAAIRGPVPMFGAQAATPGSGKSLLINAATLIPTGRMAPLMAPTADDEETRKRLLSIGLAGDPVAVIDNVEGELGSPPLAMALTAEEVNDRLLGTNRKITVSLRPVWAFTGNNVRLKGDLGRRVVPIDLDPKMEHPEDRVFERADLLGYVRANRPRLVVAALTVLRAFVVAGRPGHGKPPKGSYEAWDALVRASIIWAGGADPLGGVQRLRSQSDDDLDRLQTLIAAWHHTFGCVETSVADAIEKAGESGDLHTALAMYCRRAGQLDAREIGNALRKACGRPADGKRFRRGAPNRIKVATWAIEILPRAS